MSISYIYGSYNTFMRLAEGLDDSGTGLKLLSKGMATTTETLKNELGLFMLSLANGYNTITNDQAELLDLTLDKGFIYTAPADILRAAASIEAPSGNNNASISAFLLNDALTSYHTGENSTVSTETMIGLFKMMGKAFMAAGAGNNPLAEWKYDRYISDLENKAILERGGYDDMVRSSESEKEETKPASAPQKAEATNKKATSATAKKTSSTSSGTKKTASSTTKKKTGGKPGTKAAGSAVFDDILSFDFEAGYELNREKDQNGEEKVYIRGGAYTDDEGQEAYECKALVSYIEIVDSDDDKIPAGERLLDTVRRRNETGKFMMISEELRTGFLVREAPLNFLGHILKYCALMIGIEGKGQNVIAINDVILWDDEDQEKNLAQYRHLVNIINSVRVKGQALPPLDMTPEELMEKMAPDFEGKDSIKGSIGVQFKSGDEIVSESKLVGDDNGGVHIINDSHGPNKLDGKYDDYEIRDGGLGNCKKTKRVVRIPEGVTAIESNAFEDCRSLTEVTIPSSVREIGISAFNGCTKLKKIILPEGIKEIPWNCFLGCTELTEVVIPSSVTEISMFAFSECKKLQAVNLPAGLETLGMNAFSECESLTEIALPEKITVVEDSLFFGCKKLASVHLPDGITSICDHAFRGCESLAEINFPQKLETIGSFAFDTCESITEVEIPDSVKSIGDWAFDGCESLRSVSLPSSVELGSWAFPEDDDVKIVYRVGNGRTSRRKPASPAAKPAAAQASGRTGKYTETDPASELYSHYGKLKREADKFRGSGIRYEQNNGEEFQALRLKEVLENAGKQKTEIYRKITSFINSDKYALKDTALKIAQIFRVDRDAFVARHDDEGDVRERLMDKKYKLSALRSFAWTLADLADREGKSIDDYDFNELSEICAFTEGRAWLNYEGESWFDGLCGHDDIHVCYMPDQLICSGEAEQIFDTLGMNPIVSLEAFRNDLARLKNVIIRLHNGLLKTRKRSEKLTGPEAAVILAWCVMAVSADEPFFSEDGPMFFYHDYPDDPVNTKEIAVTGAKADVKKATPKEKEAEASAVMNNAANYEILKGSDGRERIKLGEYPVGSPIVWLVLEKKGNELLLISEYGLDAKAYSWEFQDKPSEWATSSLRKWLNEDFLEEAFDENERAMIREDRHDTYKKTAAGEEDTGFVTDKVFLLSAKEVKDYFPSQRDKICKATAFARSQGAEISSGPDQCCWWLRSPSVEAMGLSGWAGSVQSDGNMKGWGYGTREYCARPVIRVLSDRFKIGTSAESKISTLEDTLASVDFGTAGNEEEQKAIDEAKKIINKMSGDLESTKSALEKHAEELKRQEEEKEKRKAEAKAKGKSSKDEADMLAVLLIEEDQGNLDRADDDFAEVYAEDFAAYTAKQLIKLRSKIKPKMHDRDFVEAATEEMLSRTVKDRFSISTANWFNLSNLWDFNEKGDTAIEKTRQYYRDSEMNELRKLMEEHKQVGIDSVNRQLTNFNSAWDSFSGVRNDLRISIGSCDEPIPDSRKVFDAMIDGTNHAYIQLQHPSMGFLTIPIMNLFASVWKTTPEKVWDAALGNPISDSRSVSSMTSRADAEKAKKKALSAIPTQKSSNAKAPGSSAQQEKAKTSPTPSIQSSTTARDNEKMEQRKRIMDEMASLEIEKANTKGLFAGMKKKKIDKKLDELSSLLRSLSSN